MHIWIVWIPALQLEVLYCLEHTKISVQCAPKVFENGGYKITFLFFNNPQTSLLWSSTMIEYVSYEYKNTAFAEKDEQTFFVQIQFFMVNVTIVLH